jgi:GNAT superfamily N-acetyltransferase
VPGSGCLVCPFNAGLADVLLPTCSFNSMDYTIRRAKREDCEEILELVRELAVFERAPDEVTVSLQHFEESGFGNRPVWWAFVACAMETRAAEATMSEEKPAASVQDTLLASLIPGATQVERGERTASLEQITSSLPVEPMIQLEEAVTPEVPEPVQNVMPLMQGAMPCERVIGFALYYIRYSTWKGQRMYLEDILVTETWRGKGVGTALMDALIAAAKAEGLHGISWQVLEWNEPAMKFYERYNPRFDKEWLNVAIDV